MIIVQIIYAAILVLLGWLNAKWIMKGEYKRIKHGLQGALHIAVALLCSYFFVWWAGFIILCQARIVFNISLYRFQNLSIFYVSKQERPRSFLDRVEKRLFVSSGVVPFFIYFSTWIILNVIYFK